MKEPAIPFELSMNECMLLYFILQQLNLNMREGETGIHTQAEYTFNVCNSTYETFEQLMERFRKVNFSRRPGTGEGEVQL